MKTKEKEERGRGTHSRSIIVDQCLCKSLLRCRTAIVFDVVLALMFQSICNCSKVFELFGHHPPCSGIDTSHPRLPLAVCLSSQYVSLLHMTEAHLCVSQCPLTPNLLLWLPQCFVPMQLSTHPRHPVCSQPRLHCLISTSYCCLLPVCSRTCPHMSFLNLSMLSKPCPSLWRMVQALGTPLTGTNS